MFNSPTLRLVACFAFLMLAPLWLTNLSHAQSSNDPAATAAAEPVQRPPETVAQPAQKETPKDETPKDETPKDETPKDETPKDETPKDETPKDEKPQAADANVDEQADAALPAGHSQHGESFNEGPRQSAYVMKGMGPIRFPVTSVSAEAARFVEQGMGQLHGFWFLEAERSFRQAATFDSNCAFAYWGMAMANEGNGKRAKDFIALAMERKDGASDVERRMIEALNELLTGGGKRKEKSKKYVAALESIVNDHPDVLEARAFLAYALYKYRGDLKKDYESVEKVIQQVLAEEPMHSVHHYRIHLWDFKDPARALDSAARCGQSSAGIAHMWHMPGHIYSRLKRYEDAVWQQEASARVDHAHMMRDQVMPDQIHNFAHNNEWLIRNMIFIGRWRDAVDLAKNMTELPQHPKYNTLSRRGSAYYGRQRLLTVLDSYERWAELIDLCQQPYLAPTNKTSEQIKRLRHLGVALVREGQVDEGKGVLAELEAMVGSADPKSASPAPQAGEPTKQGESSAAAAKESAGSKPAGSKSSKTDAGAAKKAIALIQGHLALLENDLPRAIKLLEAGGASRRCMALIKCRAGLVDEAIKLARDELKNKDNQVLPLATLAEVLWLADKKEEAAETFEKLRAISGSLQFGTPVFERLAPLAQHAGHGEDWRIEKKVADDTGERPDLDALGPFRWQPVLATDFALQDTDGKTFSLKQYQGKPVVVIFYLGHGCLHCAEQLQAFAPMAEKFQQAGISLIAISTDTPKDLKISVDAYPGGMPFPLVSNDTLEIFRAYRVVDDFENAPLHGTFVIDPQGLIRWQDISYEPFMDPAFVLKEAQRLLAQERPTPAAANFARSPAVAPPLSFRHIQAAGIDGTVLLNGRGQTSEEALGAFLDLAQRDQSRLLIIRGPTKSAPGLAVRLLQTWEDSQGQSFQMVRVNSSDEETKCVAAVGEATGVWLDGGDRQFWRDLLSGTALGKACRELLQRGGILGGSAEFSAVASSLFYRDAASEAAHPQGLGWIPGSLIDTLESPENAAARMAIALEKQPHYLGYHLGTNASLLVRGRRLRLLGQGRVTIHFAASTTHPDASVALTPTRRVADLTALRRLAVVRTAPPFPPRTTEKPAVENGSLVIVGGGGMPQGLLERFVELAGGEKASIIVIPISMPDPLPKKIRMADALRHLGAREVTVLTGRTPEAVCAPASLAALRKATGVWFGGGRQWRFMDAYEGTQAAKLMHDLLQRGGVIGGSSAGASVQGDYMARGNPLGSGPIMADGYERGLRFLQGVAIDQHFSQRNRFGDMASLMDRYPQLLGIGIDEGTALLVQGHVAEVVGQNRVCFYDRNKTVEEGQPAFESVAAGGKYDLAARKTMAPSPTPAPLADDAPVTAASVENAAAGPSLRD